MKTTKEDILMTSLTLFAQRGFDAVSTSMIAGELGITKGALYRHFDSKKAIFDSIIEKMYELDEKQAASSGVPTKVAAQDGEDYEETSVKALCEFVNEQFMFWTDNAFACLFRRMLTIEQFKSPEMKAQYQTIIGAGPVSYTEALFEAMIRDGQLKAEAEALGARQLALQLFAPLKLAIELFDGGEDRDVLREDLKKMTETFKAMWALS